tara:strand:- start:111 stop:395 length:285 start_codon:yes stop_codon:yes gene_type:complete
MKYKTTFKEVRNKYGDVSIVEVRIPQGKITLKERQADHKRRHPNDKNQKKTKGIFWGKRGYKDDILDEFYRTHAYCFVDADGTQDWVYIGGEEE